MLDMTATTIESDFFFGSYSELKLYCKLLRVLHFMWMLLRVQNILFLSYPTYTRYTPSTNQINDITKKYIQYKVSLRLAFYYDILRGVLFFKKGQGKIFFFLSLTSISDFYWILEPNKNRSSGKFFTIDIFCLMSELF